MNDGVAQFRLHVNGGHHEVTVPPETPLLDVLRDELGLHGVRTGCRMGECGACTVLVRGRAARSCDVAVEAIGDAPVVTPEGLGTSPEPGGVQHLFLEEQAAQCGFCINGIIMQTVALQDDPPPTEQAIRSALSESICRCGTHTRILRAVRRALGAAPRGEPGPRIRRMEDGPDTGRPPPPAALVAAPSVEDWLDLETDGTVAILSGRVEFGQGIRTALRQIVAGHLGVPLNIVTVRSVTTGSVPDEAYTSGSQSVEEGGTALAMAATALRRLVLSRAATTLGVSASELRWSPDGISTPDRRTTTLVDVRRDGPLSGIIEESDLPHWTGFPIGAPTHREDLTVKLSGSAAYVHDMVLPGMVHARAVLPPDLATRLHGRGVDQARAMPGVREVVHDDRVLVVLADRQVQAIRAVSRLQREMEHQPFDAPTASSDDDVLTKLVVRRDPDVRSIIDAHASGWSATYSHPYQAHAAVAPSCGVAVAHDDGSITVWTHSQGVYPLRRELAVLLDLPETLVTIHHRDGPGTYGHNLADDAAAFAVVAARAVPGTPVRFQFSVQDEFGWEPYGSAMSSTLEAALDEDGKVAAWQGRITTDVHGMRPNGDGDRLMVAWLRDGGRAVRWPGAHAGGARNATPIYRLPAVDVVCDHAAGPLRVSALRALGAFHNLFAIESFMDELAEAAGMDPLAFRLAHLDDERARAVLEEAAAQVEWRSHVGPSGRGIGLAVVQYKESKAYVGMAVHVEVDTTSGDIRVPRIVLVCDAGTIVNPDGLANQLEGGALQGLSRSTVERLEHDGTTVRSRDWPSYPVLRFPDVPDIQVVLLDRPGLPPLGAGEAASPAVPAALANAIDDAVGIRMRDLPITSDAIRARLMAMDDRDAARVRL